MRKHKKFLVFLALSVALIFATFSRVNAAATITVNSIADNQANDGVCTLREAIVSSNTDTASGAAGGECAAGSGSGDTIEFGISGTGVKTIPITSTLPAITQTVTIDGYTQTGSTENTTSFPSPIDASLKIEVDGSGMGSGTGIDISGDGADNTTIKGVVINDVPYETIYITDSDNVTISGNFIGTDSTGLVDDGGSGHGIRMSGTATGTMIGGSSAADRNIISGNGNAGVLFYGADVSSNSVHGNYIGLGADGSTEIGNSNCGICSSSGANTNTIGGDGTGEGNIISANGVGAFNSSGAGGSNIIQGNYIGTDYLGTTAKNNHNFGIQIDENDNNTIGGTTAGARNIIAASDGFNLSLTGGSSNNTISGNYVGIGSDGSTALGGAEINLEGASNNNTIGGTTSGARNVISGNNGGGIGIHGSTTNSNTVIGNYIGTDSTGTLDVGNATYGVVLDNSPSNTIGGTTGVTVGGNCTGACNLISGNGNEGVWLYGNSADSNTIKGNYIGTDVSGNIGLGNAHSGVNFENGPDSNLVGGSTTAERNIISDNDYHGVGMYSSADALDNVISGNYIGTGADGTTDLGNAWEGVYASDHVQATLIGGTTSGQANLIKNNNGGVAIVDATATNNAIIGNSLYRNDSTAIDLQGNGISDPNDAGDTDTGGNSLLNKPEWGLYDDDSGDTEVTYDLDVPAGDYRIETFSDNGKTLVDTQNITHTGSGSESFSNTITGNGYSSLRMTATEIDGGLSSGFGSTSEYSDAYSDGTETITVNSVADDQADDGECTLREAIVAANSDAESGSLDGECHAGALSDTIEFDIAGAGVHSIVPGSPLPAITADNITINGYSETGAVENSGDYSACFIGSIMIEIDGTNTVTDSGISINGADNTVIRGLAINNFTDDGINVTGAADSTVIAGNIIGLNYLGTIDEGNTADGIQLNGSSNTTIGGSNVADRNVISGNDQGGIYIGSTDTAVSILGNCVGPAANGTTDLGNTNDGVTVDGSDGAIVGGAASGSRNVLSGNGGDGIEVSTNADNVTILGNYIGLGSNGTTNLGNTFGGVNSGGPGTIVGGTATGSRNVISGNGGNGVSVYGATGSGTVQGNYIGYTANGLAAIANGDATTSSVSLQNNVQFGGTTTAARNYLTSGGLSNGIGIFGGTPFGGSSTGGNVVQGNCIGTNINCVVQAGFETRAGVILAFDTFNNVIGGTDIGSGNVIAGNYEGVISLSISGAGFYPLNNSIIGNNIYESTGGAIISTLVGEGIGIDLLDNPTGDFTNFSNVGVNAIDVGDADTGSNDYLNYPAIDSTSARAGELDVQFDLDVDGTAPNGYRVEFFANTTGDASGNGEGQIYLGSHNVAGDVTDEIATITISPGVITTGQYDITATATERDNSTDGFGATSEFSAFLSDQQIIQPLNNVVVAPDESSSTNNAPTGSSSQLANTGQNQAIAVMLSVVLLAGSTVIFRKLSSLKH